MLVKVSGAYFDVNHLIEKSVENAIMHTIREIEQIWPEKEGHPDNRKGAINILTSYMEQLK